MRITGIVVLALFLLPNFILVDFPGAKIIVYGIFVLVIVNYIYRKIVEKSFDIARRNDTLKLFTSMSETNTLTVENKSALPIHAVVVTDFCDMNIAFEQYHSFLYSLEPNTEKSFSYPLQGRKRGKYKLGPSTIKFTDLIGAFKFDFELDTIKEIVVYPNIYRISAVPFKSLQPLGTIKNKVPIFEDQSSVTGLRDYQYGDELKRINWKISAKHDKFMVNNYQPSISSGSLIILNLATEDYAFKSNEFYMERAIETCASLLRELYLAKQEVAFAANCRIGETDVFLKTRIGKGEGHFTNILSQMAIIQPSKSLEIRNLLDPANLDLSWGVSVFIVTPKLDEMSLYRLINYNATGHSVTIINIGPEIKKDLSLWHIGFQSFYSELSENVISLNKM